MKNFWKNKKVVVTGASGFIGRHAVGKLIAKGAQVKAILSPKTDKRKLRKIFGENINKVIFVKADLLRFKDCLKITKGQNIILNFAAVDGGSRFKLEHSAEIFGANMRIVLNMLDASVASKVDRLLLMSSIEVYPKNAKTPIKENTKWDPSEETNGYIWSKRFSEEIAKIYAKNFGLKIAIARPGNVYGPGDITGIRKGRVIPTFIDKMRKKEEIELFEGGKQEKQFIFVDDLISAVLDLTELYAICDPVNIVGKEIVTIKQLSEIIKSLIYGSTEKNVKFIMKKSKKIFSTSKLRKSVGFIPQYSLINGLKETITTFASNV
ncbi:MAG: NAD-dependent epimerase/dehydratase family protein [Candidatus Levyibacteriota bacterium]